MRTLSRRFTFASGICALMAFSASPSIAQSDPGREEVGKLEVTVYYATDGDPTAAGERAAEVSPETETKLKQLESLKFTHYRALGAETQSILKAYENWAQPLKPSDEILVRFEARSKPQPESVNLDLELWLSRKKILKAAVSLEHGQPLYLLGPEWRGGRLIIAIALADK
jgi:hypothetical protein